MNMHGWGRYPTSTSKLLDFENITKLRNVVTDNDDLIPRGNGRSYGDSSLASHIIQVRPHGYFLDFDEASGQLDVEAGVLLSEIIETFVPRGWFPKITPGTKLITVGGAIASDVHGKNHHVAGCFSECVEFFNLMLPDGNIVRCSRDENTALFRATCGGMGLTGIIIDARIHLERICSQYIDQVTMKTTNLEETFEAFESCSDNTYSVAWIDCYASGNELGRCLLMTGEFTNDGDLDYKPCKRLNIPFNLPSFTLNSYSVKTFNWLYYNRARNGVSRQRVNIDSFFYPLDAIRNWNRIYGRKGFVQYQCALPKQSSFEGLQKILTTISASGKPSFLAVLKLFGEANNNYLSFPMEGYTLALDFKVDDGVFALLDLLDQIVLDHGGRIYLTKDARMSQDMLEQGYPQVETFRNLRKEHQMDTKFNSLQSTRLGL